jgi:hypothetical protein
VRYTVYRKFCSDVQLRISFRTRRMRNARSADNDPEPAAGELDDGDEHHRRVEQVESIRRVLVEPQTAEFQRQLENERNRQDQVTDLQRLGVVRGHAAVLH